MTGEKNFFLKIKTLKNFNLHTVKVIHIYASRHYIFLTFKKYENFHGAIHCKPGI